MQPDIHTYIVLHLATDDTGHSGCSASKSSLPETQVPILTTN